LGKKKKGARNRGGYNLLLYSGEKLHIQGGRYKFIFKKREGKSEKKEGTNFSRKRISIKGGRVRQEITLFSRERGLKKEKENKRS